MHGLRIRSGGGRWLRRVCTWWVGGFCGRVRLSWRRRFASTSLSGSLLRERNHPCSRCKPVGSMGDDGWRPGERPRKSVRREAWSMPERSSGRPPGRVGVVDRRPLWRGPCCSRAAERSRWKGEACTWAAEAEVGCTRPTRAQRRRWVVGSSSWIFVVVDLRRRGYRSSSVRYRLWFLGL